MHPTAEELKQRKEFEKALQDRTAMIVHSYNGKIHVAEIHTIVTYQPVTQPTKIVIHQSGASK